MESYSVRVDEIISTKEQLFARFTDTIYLGESGIKGWDQFNDLMWLRFRESQIVVEVFNEDLTGLSDVDRRYYLENLFDLQGEFPNKVILKGQSAGARLWVRARWRISLWRDALSRLRRGA